METLALFANGKTTMALIYVIATSVFGILASYLANQLVVNL